MTFKEFSPKLTSGTRYRGFKLTDKMMVFTSGILPKVLPLNPVTLFFDSKNNIIKISHEGIMTIPKDGRVKCNFSDLKVERGRYYLIDEKDDGLYFKLNQSGGGLSAEA
jgi:ArsR family metal-binding transcriptional regulator